MLCSLSGEAPQEPVVSKLSGAVFEKRLIEKYIEENGKDPVSGEDLTLDDLLPIKTSRVVRPRPPTLTSIPALLSTFQNEWDALALETYNLGEQLARTREELATSLYQHDAAVRVIARLTKERDEARDALSRVTVSAGSGSNGDAMAVDAEALPDELADKVDETQARLSKSRKKRPVPEGWATAEDITSFAIDKTNSLPVPQSTTVSVEEGYAAVGGLQGDVAIYSIDSDKVERSLQVNEPITDSIWDGTKVFFSTSKGSVKIFENGNEIASFSDHAGPATGISIHPSKEILASIGSDKSFVFYDLVNIRRATRVYTNAALTACAFHPDGHLFAAGTSSGEIKLFMTKTGEEAASFNLGAPVQAIVFSENGFWFAATAKGQTTVTIFDLRKEGDAAQVKVLDIGSAVQSLAWDYSQQFLATAGPAGVTVQQYSKGSKSWSEPLRAAVSAVDVKWAANANKLVAVNADGVISVLAAKES
ncbi:Prp19-domain-containing protein [Hypomontagnella submonticulosa]|nr:Prp19-domain-containing protein [Hypomontagnella submonticulosa]